MPLVRRLLAARVPEQEVEDMEQEVFKTAFELIENGRFEKRFHGPAFRKWLCRIVFNKVGNFRKKRERQESNSRGRTADIEEKTLLARRALEMVRPEFEPTTYEAAVQFIEGGPASEVAAALGKSVNAVYIAKSRVMKRVRAVLEKPGELGSESGFKGSSPGGES